jgi:hypothetical protein
MPNFQPRTMDDKARRGMTEDVRSGRTMGGLVPPGAVQDMTGGGLVPPGPEGVDTVPAVMEGGTAMLDAPPGEGRQEYVLTPEMVEALGGVEQLDKLRAAVSQPGEVEERREMTGEGMVPEEIVEPAPSLVPQMASGGAMEDDYFNARLAYGGVVKDNAGRQIGSMMNGQLLDERGRARGYLGQMSGGGVGLTLEEQRKREQMQAMGGREVPPAPVQSPAPERSLAGRRADAAQSSVAARREFSLPEMPEIQRSSLAGRNRGTTPAAVGLAPVATIAAPASVAWASSPASPSPPANVLSATPEEKAAFEARRLAPAGKYDEGPWKYLKPGMYGADPARPFVVSDEGGVQVIRGPQISQDESDLAAITRAALLKEQAGRTASPSYKAPSVVEDEEGRKFILRGDDAGNVKIAPLSSEANPDATALLEQAAREVMGIEEPAAQTRKIAELRRAAEQRRLPLEMINAYLPLN